MKKVLLFDFDGTIADSFENLLSIVDVLAKKYNFQTIPPEELEELRSQDISAVMKQLHLPVYKLPFMIRDMKHMQQKQIATIEPILGMPQVLEQLKENGYVMGILTSNGKENVQQFLKNHSLEFFDYISSDSSLFGKDTMIKKFMKQQFLTKADIIYIGDEIRDIQACKKVGIPIISVSWGFNTKIGLINFQPDHIVDKPDELLSLLNQMESA